MFIQPSIDFKAILSKVPRCVCFLTIYFSCSLDFTHFQNDTRGFIIFPNQEIPVYFQCHLNVLHLCFLKVDFVVCRRNGSGTNDLLGRSTQGIYRSRQLLLMNSALCCSLIIVIATIMVTFVPFVIILLEAQLPSPVENSLQFFLCLPTSCHSWKRAYSLDRIKLALEHKDICCTSSVIISAFSLYQKTSSGTFRPFVNFVYFLELCKPYLK